MNDASVYDLVIMARHLALRIVRVRALPAGLLVFLWNGSLAAHASKHVELLEVPPGDSVHPPPDLQHGLSASHSCLHVHGEPCVLGLVVEPVPPPIAVSHHVCCNERQADQVKPWV